MQTGSLIRVQRSRGNDVWSFAGVKPAVPENEFTADWLLVRSSSCPTRMRLAEASQRYPSRLTIETAASTRTQ